MNFDKQEITEFKNIIEAIVDVKIDNRRIPSYISAVVVDVDANDIVSVFIPPDMDKKVTGLLNKTGEILQVGDSVELATKNGRLSNAWVALKHGNSQNNIQKQLNQLQQQISQLQQEISVMKNEIMEVK